MLFEKFSGTGEDVLRKKIQEHKAEIQNWTKEELIAELLFSTNSLEWLCLGKEKMAEIIKEELSK